MRISVLAALFLLVLAGCGGSDRPINKDLDMPKEPGKEKEKTEKS